MQLIRQWSMVLCVAAIGTSLLQSVLPEKGAYSVIKLVLGLYILITLLSPVQNFSASDLKLNFEPVDVEILQSDITGAVLNQAQSELEKQLVQAFAESQIPVRQISVSLQVDAEGIVAAESVTVVSAADGNIIRTTVENTLGCEVDLTILSPDGMD